MKKLLFVSLLASPLAFAGATEPHVTHHYKDISRSTPYQECHNVEVPIYGNVSTGRTSKSDVLGGMIVGGLLGKAVTGDDKGAAFGAVIGGMESVNGHERGVVGYKQQQRCQTKYNYTTEKVYSHSIARFTSNGTPYNVRFNR